MLAAGPSPAPSHHIQVLQPKHRVLIKIVYILIDARVSPGMDTKQQMAAGSAGGRGVPGPSQDTTSSRGVLSYMDSVRFWASARAEPPFAPPATCKQMIPKKEMHGVPTLGLSTSTHQRTPILWPHGAWHGLLLQLNGRQERRNYHVQGAHARTEARRAQQRRRTQTNTHRRTRHGALHLPQLALLHAALTLGRRTPVLLNLPGRPLHLRGVEFQDSIECRCNELEYSMENSMFGSL